MSDGTMFELLLKSSSYTLLSKVSQAVYKVTLPLCKKE